MSGSIRYHFDEGFIRAPLIAVQLRARGIVVTTSVDASLLAASDQRQLEYAIQTGSVLVTQDQDFLAIHSAHPEHCGIIFVRQGGFTIGDIIRELAQRWESYGADEMINHLEYLKRGSAAP